MKSIREFGWVGGLVVVFVSVQMVYGTDYYVALNGSDTAPYTNRQMAASSIPPAIALAGDGDTVWVSPGIYYLASQLELTNGISLRSEGDSDETVLDGQNVVRCAYLSHLNSLVDGFTIRNGMADGVGDDMGGGLYFSTNGTVRDCIIENCHADGRGGGVYFDDGGYMQHCTILDNSAERGGGAQFSNGGEMLECMVIGNQAVNRGAGLTLGRGGIVWHCLIVSNTCPTGIGGGVFIFDSGRLRNCTVIGNSADDGGGVYCQGGGGLKNTILQSNMANTNINWRATSELFASCCTEPARGTDCVTNAPLFMNVSEGNYRLHWDSPCIDTGLLLTGIGAAVDLDGVGRPLDGDQNGSLFTDIGAYEYIAATSTPVISISAPLDNAVLAYGTVICDLSGSNNSIVGVMSWTNMQSSVSGSFDGATPWSVSDILLVEGLNTITVSGTNLLGVVASDSITIRCRGPVHYVSLDGGHQFPYTNWVDAATNIASAINACSPWESVLVSNGLYSITTQLVVDTAITVESLNGAGCTLIDGGGVTRCFYLDDVDSLIRGFTITNGYTTGSGGGVYLGDTGGTIELCNIMGNRATKADQFAGGGGVYSHTDGLIRRCVISGNRGFNGGGVHLLNNPNRMENCLLINNKATGSGGGVCLSGVGAEVFNCTITANKGNAQAGGIYDSGGEVWNCVVYDNINDDNWFSFSMDRKFHNLNTIPAVGSACITNAPLFMNADAGNYRLRWDSPCLDAGSNVLFMGVAQDMDGRERPLDGTRNGSAQFDIGAYEYRSAMGVPELTIVFPVTNHIFAYTGSTIFSGIHNDEALGILTWTNHTTSVSGAILATTPWSVPVPLVSGTNSVTFAVTNIYGQMSTETIEVERGGLGTPIVAITNDILSTPFYLFDVDGMCNEHVAGMLVWTNILTGQTGSLAAASSWGFTLDVELGTNVIMVTGTNLNGVVSETNITVIRTVCQTLYVSMTGTQVSPYTNWATASRSIKRAVDIAADGDTVLIAEGLYQAPETKLTNGVTACALPGDHVSVRGALYNRVFLLNHRFAVLDGLEIYKGTAGTSIGAGVLCSNGVVRNCLIRNCYSKSSGAGIYMDNGLIENCTVTANKSYYWSATGIYSKNGIIRNTIIQYNYPDGQSTPKNVKNVNAIYENCCVFPAKGSNCITNMPQFIDKAHKNYRLACDSLCIDTGMNKDDLGHVDLDGNIRIVNGTVDMGAYEYDGSLYDSDLDTMTDDDEYIADTDPTDSNSCLCIITMSNQPPVTVYFESSSNRLYSMIGCSKLVDGSWTNVLGNWPRAGVNGADAMQDTNVPAQGPYYRLEVQLP